MTAHVYRCYEADGRLAYIGASRNVWGRLQNHRATASWAHLVTRVQIKVYPDYATALEVERQAIRAENPRWNVKGRWSGRHQWVEQDWLDYIATRKAACGHSEWVRHHLDRVEAQYAAKYGSAQATA